MKFKREIQLGSGGAVEVEVNINVNEDMIGKPVSIITDAISEAVASIKNEVFNSLATMDFS